MFGGIIGAPLSGVQLDALRLDHRITCIQAPRQTGKSRSLSVLATWWAYRQPNQHVLIVSASDEAASRLLRAVRDLTDHPLLRGSVLDETMHRVVLSNQSEIRSVPASERAVRGWTADLLLLDEAAFMSDDLLLSAALPTTAARPDARTVMASTPWGTGSAFANMVLQGENPEDPHTRTFRWRLADASWIQPDVIEAARASMSPIRFRAEFEGEFTTAEDALLDPADVAECVADFPLRRDGAGMPAVAGLDWGRARDAHAVAVVGLLDDFGVNPLPIVVVPYVESSRRPYGAQVESVAALSRLWSLTILSEVNGVGQYPTERLDEALGGWTRCLPKVSTQQSKEDAYGRLAVLVQDRRIVLPREPELLRQLTGLVARPTAGGGLRIEARTERIHDDLPDALALALSGLPQPLASPERRDPPEDAGWVETPAGVQVPLPVATCRPEVDWGSAYGSVPVRADNPWRRVYGAHEESTADRIAALTSLAR